MIDESKEAAAPGSPPCALDPVVVLGIYRCGGFMMGEPDGGVAFYEADPRAILPIERFRGPRSARRKLARGEFEVSFDTAFGEVIRGCAAPRSEGEGRWINEMVIASMEALHRLGRAHSVEVRRDGRLVGGLYGLSLGSAFFAESMFSRIAEGGSDASSAALTVLVDRLRRRGFALLDCQYANDHTRRLGVIEIPAQEYRRLLAQAVSAPDRW